MTNIRKASKRQSSIFISYAREDIDSARKLYVAFKAHGLKPWLDVEDIKVGDAWKPAIIAAIQRCDYFVAVLSSHSVKKTGFVQRELREALSALDERPEGHKFIFPVRLNKCSPSHMRLNDISWVDLFPSWSEGLAKLFESLNITSGPMFAAPEDPEVRTRRLNLVLSDPVFEELLKIKERAGIASMADVVRISLGLISFALKERMAGNLLLIQRGDTTSEIILPIAGPVSDYAVDSRE